MLSFFFVLKLLCLEQPNTVYIRTVGSKAKQIYIFIF